MHRIRVSKTSTTPASKMSEEEDLAVLIYKSSKTAKARAAAAAAKDKKQKNVASPVERRTSTRKRYASQDGVASMDRPRKKRAVSEKRQSLEDSQKARGRKGDWRKYAKICSADGCTNIAKKGGVCKRHGAKVEYKKCSSARCTNRAKSGGVCIRHGAKVEYKRCRIEGCMNHVIKGGVCVKHGDIYALLPKRKPQKYKGESDEDFNKYKKDLDKAHRNRDSSLIISIRNERRAKINASAVQKKSIKRRQLRQQQIHQREQRRLQQQQSNPQLPHLPVNHQPPNRVYLIQQLQLLSPKQQQQQQPQQQRQQGCINQAKRGGVCWRHEAKRTPTDESTAFGSEFDKTTAADLPLQSTTDSLHERSTIGVPEEVVVCREIVKV